VGDYALNFSETQTLAATGAGTAMHVGKDRHTARLTMVTTAKQGTTPTLDVIVESSPDNTNWTTRGTYAQRVSGTTLPNTLYLVVAPLDEYLRVSWTSGGTNTPGWTFTVTGEVI